VFVVCVYGFRVSGYCGIDVDRGTEIRNGVFAVVDCLQISHECVKGGQKKQYRRGAEVL
jgi:hypothetical protein